MESAGTDGTADRVTRVAAPVSRPAPFVGIPTMKVGIGHDVQGADVIDFGAGGMIEIPETIGTPDGPSVDGASAHLLKVLLGAFEDQLVTAGIPVNEFLRPGAPPAKVHEIFAKNGLTAPDEAVVWFGWHDGPVRGVGDEALPIFEFWSIEEADARRNAPRALPMGYEDWQWIPTWMQIMGDANGLAIECGADAKQSPLVRGLSWGEPSTQPGRTLSQVVSLCTPVAWWIDALRHGWYAWDPDENSWDTDRSGQPAIRALRGLS